MRRNLIFDFFHFFSERSLLDVRSIALPTTQVYTIPLGGAKFRSGYSCGGSGSAYIMGLIDNDFKPKMSEAECRTMCKKWVAHAMARDGSSGGVIRTVVIKKEGVHEDFTPGDKLPYQAL